MYPAFKVLHKIWVLKVEKLFPTDLIHKLDRVNKKWFYIFELLYFGNKVDNLEGYLAQQKTEYLMSTLDLFTIVDDCKIGGNSLKRTTLVYRPKVFFYMSRCH